MIKCIDKIEYLTYNDELERIMFSETNENFKRKIENIFSSIYKIKSEKNIIVTAYGNLNNKVSFKLDCDDCEEDVIKKIQDLCRF